MRTRILSVLLALSLALALMPAAPVWAETYPDPAYNRLGTPEVAIFNVYTGANTEFFKKEMLNHFFNAVAAGWFVKESDSNSYLNYEVKVTESCSYWWWTFAQSNLALLSDKYGQLKVGYATTLKNNSHTHRYGFLGVYSSKMTSWMVSALYCGGIREAIYSSRNPNTNSRRFGNGEFSELADVINGANSRFAGVNPYINRGLQLAFTNSTIYYDSGKRECTCGGSAEGCVVSFYDGTAPAISSVQILRDGAACTNFKAGDTVTVVLKCTEALRFADDDKTGKGNVYIGLIPEGSFERLHAHLTKLDQESLTFTYTVPTTETRLFTITGLDLKSAPTGGTALVHSKADVALTHLYMGQAGHGSTKKYTAKNPTTGGSELGFTKTTSVVTDMAGNALGATVPATHFYIDCEKPFAARAVLTPVLNNADVKAALGKTGMASNTGNSEDLSDQNLGVGDSFDVTLYMNEVVTGPSDSVSLTTNIVKDGNPVVLTAQPAGTVKASSLNLGSQYGLGASGGMVSVFKTDSVVIEDGMSVSGSAGIKLSAIAYTSITDASANAAQNTSSTFSPTSTYYVDTTPPVAIVGDAVQTAGISSRFYVPFKVTDAASGVAQLPATLTLTAGDSSSAIRYAVTASATEPSSWEIGAFGSSIAFTQTGAQQYLHVAPVFKKNAQGEDTDEIGETYDFKDNAELTFTLSDYAGNSGTTAAKTLAGVSFDSIAPRASSLGTDRRYDSEQGQGILSVTVRAQDSGGLAFAYYLWAEDGVVVTADTAGWSPAVGALDGYPTQADVVAEAYVAPHTTFSKDLWIKVVDASGNVGVENLGAYAYSLSDITYDLSYVDPSSPTSVTTEPVASVTNLESGGTLVFDVRRSDAPNTHYIYAASSTQSNIFDFASNTWHTAAFSNTAGYSFTNLADAGDFADGFTGNLYVTVYSGKGDTIAVGADAITATTNAGVESFVLRISAPNNDFGDVFTGTNVLTAATGVSGRVSGLPWKYGSGETVLSTLDGVQLLINLGDDKNGWGFADVDWETSFISLDDEKLCNIGIGPVQTVTLPASDKYTDGEHTLSLTLTRLSDPSGYGVVLDQTVFIDGTKPGNLALGVLAKEDRLYTGKYTELAYELGEILYLPFTGNHNIVLGAHALDASGALVDLSGAVNFEGAMDIVAWNAADPSAVISLADAHLDKDVYTFYDDATGEYSFNVSISRTDNYYTTTGDRILTIGTQTDAATGTLGVPADEDSVIALQVRYANGKASAITYLTVHPVTMSLTGTVSITPSGEGILTADPGTASVIFTPADGINMAGYTIHCDPGWLYEDGHYSYGWGGGEMLPESDGTYVYSIPRADSEKFEADKNAAQVALEAGDMDLYVSLVSQVHRGIFEPERLQENDDALTYKNMIDEGGEPVGFYVVYATDAYGNEAVLGMTASGAIADGSQPVISDKTISLNDDNTYTAVFTIRDDSLFAGEKPMSVELSYDSAYSAAIGADGEKLVLEGITDGYSWTSADGNKLGILSVQADLTRTGSYAGDADPSFIIATYQGCITDAYLTLTVTGVISPKITSATDMTLNIAVTDAHGNTRVTDPFLDEADSLALVGVTASVCGEKPAVVSSVYAETGEGTDRALSLAFNMPVQPEDSWILRDPTGFADTWTDAFPVWKDGTWTIQFTDAFGDRYAEEIVLADVFGEYGIDLSISTLEPVSAAEGVTITAAADGESETVSGSTKATESGSYRVTREGATGTDTLTIQLNNIFSGAPVHTVYFYFEELKESFAAGENPTGETAGSVTVTYATDRETSPVGATSQAIQYGDSDAYSFQYYDAFTDQTYPIHGKLSDYGITLAQPAAEYEDTASPAVELVTVWAQRGTGFVKREAFPGSAGEAEIRNAIDVSGLAQSYDLVVTASDYSKWKVVVKASAPASMAFADESDAIAGVTVNGNNVLIENEVAGDFYIVVVDNAAADSAASADNFTCIKVPSGGYHFDKTPPVIETNTVSTSLYERTVYLKATDADDAGNDQSAGVKLSAAGLLDNTGANAAEYPWKLEFDDNGTVVVTATDGVGNTQTAAVKVTGIDASYPVLTVTWSPCAKSAATGKLDPSNPAAGPVNTDVVAHVSSDKTIRRLSATYKTGDGEETPYDFAAGAGWGAIEYARELATVTFENPAGSLTVTLTVTGPNGRSTDAVLVLGEGVIDKVRPVLVTRTDEPVIRDGYTVPHAETHTLTFNEDVFCMDYGKPGDVYSDANPFSLTMTEDESLTLQFADRAGNITTVAVSSAGIDSIAPTLDIDVPENADATNTAVTVTVQTDEFCTLTASDPSVTCGAMTETIVDGETVWTAQLTASKNGAFRLTAADAAGNETSQVFRVSSIDRTIPTISFDASTVVIRQGAEMEELEAKLVAGVNLWDNAGIADGTLAWSLSDDEEVALGDLLDTPGVYAFVYTVEDTAGNEGEAIRYVRVIDGSQLDVAIDGETAEMDGTMNVSVGAHVLTVGNLQEDGEPYTVKLVRGLWSAGQMKRTSGDIEIGEDGSFTIEDAGFYTLYITTQSRHTFRMLINAEQ